MSELADRQCVACQGDVPALRGDELARLLGRLDGWSVDNEHDLNKTFTFPNFVKALAFTNRVGDLAEAQGHHPDIFLSWGKVGIKIWTHKIDGLTESDFILAAKIDRLPRD
ncbi:MAG: 4a-hydroxytetrahydrobiopterin dehydratase [Phycisphaerae bacterium]